jgi:transcriptional regulator with XRE-family HTH domain
MKPLCLEDTQDVVYGSASNKWGEAEQSGGIDAQYDILLIAIAQQSWWERTGSGKHARPQERLALEANIDRSYVGRIERGMENVTVSALESRAGVLGVSVAELFVEVDGDASRPPPMRSGRKPKV